MLTTTRLLDLNGNLASERSPAGSVTTYLYDERDLLIRVTQGANDSSVASTERYLHDLDGNQLEVHDDDLDMDPSDTPTVFTHDLFQPRPPRAAALRRRRRSAQAGRTKAGMVTSR